MKPQVLNLRKNIVEKIKNDIDGSTNDKKVNILIDTVGSQMPFVDYSTERTSVKLHKDTLNKIDSYRITETESRDNILTRMLLMYEEINNTHNDYWIPFKIINKYNNHLVIEGQLEYNSKEISFNYRGNVFRGKLPPTYIVNGEDLTKELYLWYDNLDWNNIINTILINPTDYFVEDGESYSLKVNYI